MTQQHDLEAWADSLRELQVSLNARKKEVEAAEARLLDRATEQKLMLLILSKLRSRLKPGEITDILLAPQRVADGDDLRSTLKRILAETPAERDLKRQTPA